MIFFAAASLRLYLFHNSILPSGLYPPLPIDDGWYDLRYGFLWANKLLDFYPSAFIFPARETYGWIIGNLLKYFPAVSYIIIYFQIGISCVALLSLKRLCTLVFNPFSGWIAVFLWGFYGLSILYDVQILKYSLILSCLIITLDFYYQAYFYGRFWNYTLFIFFTICLLCLRLEYFPAILWLFSSFFYEKIKFRPFLILGILFLVSILIVLAPSFYKTHLGIHSYMGNSIHSIGRFMDIPGILPNTSGHVACASELEPLLRERFDKHKFLDNFWLQKTLDIILNNPLNFLRITLRKFLTLISKTEDCTAFRVDYVSCFSSIFKYPWFNFQAIFILAFPAMVFSMRNKKTTALFIVIFFISLSMILTITAKPYRLQLVPVLCCFAAYGFHLIFKQRKILFFLGFSFLGYLLTFLPNSNAMISAENISNYFDFEQIKINCSKKNDVKFKEFLLQPDQFMTEDLYLLAMEFFDAEFYEDASLVFHYLLDHRQKNSIEMNMVVRRLILCYINLKRIIKAEQLLNQYDSEYHKDLKDLILKIQTIKKRVLTVELYQ